MRDMLTHAAPALPKSVARLCNQIAQERSRPYTVATAQHLRQEAAKQAEAGLPIPDLVRLLQREHRAAASIAAGVHADAPDLHRLVLAPVRMPRGTT